MQDTDHVKMRILKRSLKSSLDNLNLHHAEHTDGYCIDVILRDYINALEEDDYIKYLSPSWHGAIHDFDFDERIYFDSVRDSYIEAFNYLKSPLDKKIKPYQEDIPYLDVLAILISASAAIIHGRGLRCATYPTHTEYFIHLSRDEENLVIIKDYRLSGVDEIYITFKGEFELKIDSNNSNHDRFTFTYSGKMIDMNPTTDTNILMFRERISNTTIDLIDTRLKELSWTSDM
jgi:hypothetical protein|nr:MAG TPA: hypothetical protein [Bacteriophage sp.]